jgi:hypothetical protein
MANMSDQTWVNWILQAFFTSSTTVTFTPGTSGGSARVITPPFKLRLMTATGTNTTPGTEATSGNCPGYTAGGVSFGSSAFGNPSGGQSTNNNSVSWSASGGWSTITGIEIYDSAGSPIRYLQGALTSNITGVANGDTVQFAAGSVTINASAW